MSSANDLREANLRTPLFPDNDAPLKYKQGGVGDCYLLVAFECLWNSGEKGRLFLTSMFEQKDDKILVTLPHTEQSYYLKPEDFEKKYRYYFDDQNIKDIFVISSTTLDAIDSSAEGGRSNSLALKILERLASHYYEFNWDRRRRRGSLDAHNFKGERHPSHDSSTSFLSKILGVKTYRFSLEQIIKLKHLWPEQPVYVGMEHQSTIDQDSRHAFLLESVVINQDLPDEHDFILINPWNNQKSEPVKKAQLQIKNGRFVVYVIDPELFDQIQYVLKTPQLFDLLSHAKRICRFINSDFIRKFNKLHSEMPYLPDILNRLSEATLSKIYLHISVSGETKFGLIHSLLDKSPYTWIAEIIIRHEFMCPHSVNKLLAGIALRAINYKIYDYLIAWDFNFNLFISFHPAEMNIFFRNLVELEQSSKPEGIFKLKRINSYLHMINVHKAQSQCHIVRGSVIDPLAEIGLYQLRMEQVELLILECITKIRRLPLPFNKGEAISAIIERRKQLFFQLKQLIDESDKAFHALELKHAEQNADMTSSASTIAYEKKLDIDVLRWNTRDCYPGAFFAKGKRELFNKELLPVSESTVFSTIHRVSLC